MPLDVVLSGCAPVPLASYLKALGVLRLVAEQKAPDARGCWRGERFVLQSTLDEVGIMKFFLEEYRPTPVIAPWNGGSGFYAKDNKSGIGNLQNNTAVRFEAYRQVIRQAAELLESSNFLERPQGDEKEKLIRMLRATLDESAIEWMDAALFISSDSVAFPPLLGTGGNDGRLDFTNNFMQRLVALFDPKSGAPTPGAERWLGDAIFQQSSPALLVSAAIGQFSPGAAGGPNASAGFEANSLSNPWEFVLMIEGALLFASSAARKLGSSEPGVLSYPFTVRKAGGSGGLSLEDEGDPRGEMWLPLWQAPSSYEELRALFSEGRATLGRRAARDGLDFVRATARLGVNRGIQAFQRYSFQKRSGKAYLATPLNRVVVKRNPKSDLIDGLDRNGWLTGFRRIVRGNEAPASLRVIGRRLDDTLFAIAQEASPQNVQVVLAVIGEAQVHLAASPKAREWLRPLQNLHSDWAIGADDKSHEFRIAVSLAGLGAVEREAPTNFPMRFHFAPLGPGDYGRDVWSENSRHFVWGGGTLISNLLRVLERRLMEAERLGGDDKPLYGRPGADVAAISAFLQGDTDDVRIARLLSGLAWVLPPHSLPPRNDDDEVLPAAYAALKPIFSPTVALRRLRIIAQEARLPVPPGLVRILAGNSVQRALDMGLARTRASGLSSPFRGLHSGGLDGPRLAAALLIPVNDRTLRLTLKRIYPDPVPLPVEEGEQK